MKKKKVLQWKKTSIRHALWRAKQRDIDIAKEDIDEITYEIIYNGIKPIREESSHRDVYKTKDKKGVSYFLVFDTILQCVVTVFRENEYNFSKKSDKVRTKFEEREYKLSPNYVNDWINSN